MILEVSDRVGWAIDRLTTPMMRYYPDQVKVSYVNANKDRFLRTGYNSYEDAIQYTHELGNQAEIVHFHHITSALRYINKLDKKVKTVVSCHSEIDVASQAWDKFDKVVASTMHNYNIIKNINPNTYYVPIGIDLDKYNFEFSNPKKTVGFVGRVDKHKRFEVIKKASFDAGFRLIGCGYIGVNRYFQMYSDEIQRVRDFDFVDLLPDHKMQGLYNQMAMYVCLSEPNIETGPLPVMEAMACGVPVISTQVGWARDWATHNEDIVFINEDDLFRLPEVIKMVWDNINARVKIRNNALKLVSGFSIEKYCKNLMEVYHGGKSSFEDQSRVGKKS